LNAALDKAAGTKEGVPTTELAVAVKGPERIEEGTDDAGIEGVLPISNAMASAGVNVDGMGVSSVEAGITPKRSNRTVAGILPSLLNMIGDLAGCAYDCPIGPDPPMSLAGPVNTREKLTIGAPEPGSRD